MRYASEAGPARDFARSRKLGFVADEPSLDGAGPPPRDIKKMFLIAGLGILSWVATYVGMLELIEANMGELPLVHKVIIGFSVAMLMTMIIWLLDQMFAPVNAFTRLCYVAGYIFLTVISVGFGFGFYWKVLESRSESSRSAESAVGQVQGSLHAASIRLEQLDATLVQLSTLSHEKAEIERTKGTSCPNSKPGDGPRRKMRDDDAQRFSFASDFVKGRVAAVNDQMKALDGDLAKIASGDKSIIDAKSGTRNEFMKALGRKLDMTVTGFNAFRTDPQLKQLRTDLAERAEKSTFGDPKSGGFICPDPQLQQALRGAVRAVDQLPELEKPAIAAVEGSEATIEAFRRLTATFYGLMSFKLPPSVDELRELQQKAVQSVENGASVQRALNTESAGLSKRDYVPLAIAIFVDLCLLLVSIGRPMNRLHGLVPKMREAERGPVIEILSRFNDIHRDRDIRENFELFRHVVFDLNGDYYVAVPLDAPARLNPAEREQLRVEAQLLSNLFASFEKERIFRRTWTPFAGRIRKKLARQGSKFAESEAFRVYRFRKGAWSEIILGAVMGAARRAEDARRLQPANGSAAVRREPDLSATVGRTPPDAPAAVPSGGYPPSNPPLRMPESVRQAVERARGVEAGRNADRVQSAAKPEVRPDVAAAYGRYARYNPPHPKGQGATSTPATEVTLFPANGNTAPKSDLRAQTAPAVAEALVAFQGVGTPANGRIVPQTVDSNPPATDVEAASVPRTEPEARPEDTIVVLKRETATVSIPAGEMGTDTEIISRLGHALARAHAGVPPQSTPAETGHAESTQLIVRQPHESQVIDTATGNPADVASVDEIEVVEDPATSDAVAMAGRLRPARHGS